MTAVDEVAAFHAAEAKFWKARYDALWARVDAAHRALTGGSTLDICSFLGEDIASPPEPPVGTSFVLDGVVIWRRDPDGWRCDATSCRQCPCGWGEARNWRPQDFNRTVRHLPSSHLPAVTS